MRDGRLSQESNDRLRARVLDALASEARSEVEQILDEVAGLLTRPVIVDTHGRGPARGVTPLDAVPVRVLS